MERTDPVSISQQVRDYLLPSSESFWQWWEGGNVLAWQHGKTIAFKEELVAVLTSLASRGLPPLGAVALLLAATRNNWREWDTETMTLGELLDALPDSEDARQLLERVLQGLDRVHGFAPELRSTLEAKIALADMVFEAPQRRSSREVAAAVLEMLKLGVGEELVHRHWNFSSAELLRDLHCLVRGLGRVDEEALRMRMQTGMDDVPRSAEDIPLADRVRSLLGDLRVDEELRDLAQLASRLLAAVTLPRRLQQPDDLPVGGVTDLSNRGTLDRLLLSELAHDNLTLSVRLAMNEALFLRRESPPQSVPHRRAVLLESGIRAWGLPRLFAAAVGLALAATTIKDEETRVFRACGSRLAPVDLGTREGLIEHLEALELSPHPGAAWQAFCEQAGMQDAADPVLVTTDDVMADADFRRRLTDYPLPSLLVITLDRDGNFRLSQRTPRGTRCIRQASLSLDSLYSERDAVVTTLRDRPWTRDLPAIFSHHPFPLLLPFSIKPDRDWNIPPRGNLAIAHDRRLMYWSGSDRGALQVTDELPTGRLQWASHELIEPGGRTSAVIGGDGHRLHLLDIRLDPTPSCSIRRLETSFRYCRAVVQHGDALLVIGQRKVDVIEVDSGRLIDTQMIWPTAFWRRDRFFATGGEWCPSQWLALGFDGHSARFTPLPHSAGLLAVFECPQREGPWGVTSEGNLVDLGDGRQMPVDHGLAKPVHVAGISRDGSQLVLSGDVAPLSDDPLSYRLVDVATQAAIPTTCPTRHDLQQVEPAPAAEVRTRFRDIGVNRRGQLALGRHGGQYLAVALEGEEMRLIKSEPPEARIAFVPLKPAPPTGFRLKLAELGGGSAAVLDSRGLLHLRSASRHVLQSTLVLHAPQMAGWLQPSLVWGPPFFTGGARRISSVEAFHSAVQPFMEQLP